MAWNTKIAMTKAGLTDIAASIRKDEREEENLLLKGFEQMSNPNSVERAVLGMSRSYYSMV